MRTLLLLFVLFVENAGTVLCVSSVLAVDKLLAGIAFQIEVAVAGPPVGSHSQVFPNQLGLLVERVAETDVSVEETVFRVAGPWIQRFLCAPFNVERRA